MLRSFLLRFFFVRTRFHLFNFRFLFLLLLCLSCSIIGAAPRVTLSSFFAAVSSYHRVPLSSSISVLRLVSWSMRKCDSGCC